MGQLAAAILGIVVLHAFYRAVEVKWPGSYFTLDDVLAQRVSASFSHYLVFRLSPVAVVAFFMAATFAQTELDPLPPIAAMAIGHLGFTTGRAATGLLSNRRAYGFWSLLSGHVATALSVLGGAVLGAWLGRIPGANRWVPPLEELTATLWTAAFAGVLGAYVVRLSSRSPADTSQLVRRVRRSIPDELWNKAESLAQTADADPVLVHAIMLAENLQRPPWMRRLENLKARLGLPGTYGIMQVSSATFVTDIESVQLSLERHFGGWQPTRDEHGYVPVRQVEEIAKRHNPSSTFVGIVGEIYDHLNMRRQDEDRP